MAIPLITNLKLWVGTLFTKDDWDFNFKQLVSWLADGTADLVVGSVKATNGMDLDGATIRNVGAAQTGSEAINLDQATTLLNRSSSYYPFSVASGKVNSSGKPAYLQKDSDTQVTVLAGNTNPDLVCVQSDATIESVTSDTVLTVPASNGTYHIIKEKEAAITITSGASSKITVAPKFPTSPNIGDYFLDNSVVPFAGYKYTAQGWEETPFCWIGDVTVSSGAATVTTFNYNYNYFDVNARSLDLTLPDYSNKNSRTVNTMYTASKDCFVHFRNYVSSSNAAIASIHLYDASENEIFISVNVSAVASDTSASVSLFIPAGYKYQCSAGTGNNGTKYIFEFPLKGVSA
jgi:hypothetical protein